MYGPGCPGRRWTPGSPCRRRCSAPGRSNGCTPAHWCVPGTPTGNRRPCGSSRDFGYRSVSLSVSHVGWVSLLGGSVTDRGPSRQPSPRAPRPGPFGVPSHPEPIGPLSARGWATTSPSGVPMNARSLSRQLSLAFTVATLAAAASSEAQIIPLQSDRSIFAWVNFAGQPGHGQESHTEPNQFGPFIASADPTSWILGSCGEGEPDTCIVSLVEAHCAQNSSILDGGIQFSGYATGAWRGPDVGEYKFHSICQIRFILDIPV